MCLDGEATIDVQDKKWESGQPNNWGGNQDCALARVLAKAQAKGLFTAFGKLSKGLSKVEKLFKGIKR